MQLPWAFPRLSDECRTWLPWEGVQGGVHEGVHTA